MKKVNINKFLYNIWLKKNKSNKIKKYITILENRNYKEFIIKKIKTTIILNFINFIILISSKKSNIFLHLLDSLGNELLFYSIGSIGLNKKLFKEPIVLQNFIKKVFINLNILKNKPIVIHILNINYNTNWFINQLTTKLILFSTNFLFCFAYNGCRKKKLKKK